MFARLISSAWLVVFMAMQIAIAKPISVRSEMEFARRTDPPSFNNYLGLSSMSDFDGFYGIDNFSGSSNTQILVVQQEEIICSSVEIDIVQQKLAILVEVAKRIIIEQICEVEVQTIVIEQFESSISSFGMDVGRQSGRQVAYDSNISGMYNQIMNSDGSLSNSSHGFVGSDIGNSSIVSTGNNWNNVTSPQSVAQAKALAKTARNSTAA